MDQEKVQRFAIPFLLGIISLLIGVLVYVFVFYKPLSKGISEVLPDGRLAMPRFASFRSEEVNVRVGPGPQYPILWVYKRLALPVEITAEFDTWRKIRDFEGNEGWVNKGMLSSKRHVIVTAKNANLYNSPNRDSGLRAVLQKGVIAQITEIQDPWAYVKISGLKGWILIHDSWGVFHQPTSKEENNK
jgi:SH3-like domain-containing protein